MDKATARPWEINAENSREYTKQYGVAVIRADKVVAWAGRRPYGESNHEADAALIVKAVNQHDALLELARDMDTYLQAVIDIVGGPEPELAKLKARARAILEQEEE